MATYEAQCSKVGSFGYADYFKLYVILSDGEVSENSSKVNYDVYCQSSGSGSINANHYKYFSLNGQEIVNTSENVNVSSPNAYIHIASGTTGYIEHDTDGNKTISFSAKIEANSYGVSASINTTFNLVKIQRYANISHSLHSAGIDEIKINWNTDAECDLLDYSLNNGAWINTAGNPYTISNLEPNTTYTIRTRLRRSTNHLYSETGILTVTTKDIAKITELNNFYFGDTISLKKSNPSGYTNKIRIVNIDNNEVIKTIDNTSDNMNINFTQIELDKLYKLLNGDNIKLRFYLDTIYKEKQWASYKDIRCLFNGNAKTGHIFINNQPKRAFIWIKVNGNWKRAIAWIKINNKWKRSI